MGLILLNHGKFDEEKEQFSRKNNSRAEAEEFFKKEIEINPNSNSYTQLEIIKLGKAMPHKRKEVAHKIIEEAQQYFYKALELEPTAKSINFYIGESYLAQEKPDEAPAFFEKETANRPSKNETYFINAKSFLEIAKIHQTKGNHIQAIENLNYAGKEIGDKESFAHKIFKLADISYSELNKTKEEKKEFIIEIPLGRKFEKEHFEQKHIAISLQGYLNGDMRKNKKSPTTSINSTSSEQIIVNTNSKQIS